MYMISTCGGTCGGRRKTPVDRGSGRSQCFGFMTGEDRRQTLDGRPQVVKLSPAVALHGQFGVGVPGQLHGLLERRAAFVQESYVTVPQGVEVGEQRTIRP